MPGVADAIPQVVRLLADRIGTILGERLVGLYLAGSFAMADLAPTSDYDVLVVTEGDLTAEELAQLDEMHEALLREHTEASRLEGDYAPRQLLVPGGTTMPVPGIRDGRFEADEDEVMMSADNIANLRSHGIAVVGPPPASVLPIATRDDVRAAVRAMLVEGPGECLTEQDAAGDLLNLARSLAALEAGEPTTKSAGAAWALAHLDARWHDTIRRAVDVRNGAPVAPDDRRLRDALPRLDRALRPLYECSSAADRRR